MGMVKNMGVYRRVKFEDDESVDIKRETGVGGNR